MQQISGCGVIVSKVSETTESDCACSLTTSSLAPLKSCDSSEFNVVELKRWLECRGAPMSGRKRSSKLYVAILEGKLVVTLRVGI